MLTYTFIIEFRGGIYISQVHATDLRHSVKNWSQTLDIKEIKYFGEQSQKELIKAVSDEVPTPITGLTNVWCLSLSLRVGFLIVNIVQTMTEGLSPT